MSVNYADEWETKRILILVKTYPSPSAKYQEVVCTAGITDKGEFIRIYPVKFRYLSDEQKFKKFSWIEARVKRNPNDKRLESFKVDYDSIKVIGRIEPKDKVERFRLLEPLISASMHKIEDDQTFYGKTLGMFMPLSIIGLNVEETKPDWSEKELMQLSQISFGDKDVTPLEKIPYDFSFSYRCSDTRCNGHNMKITDWELYQAYRNFTSKYGKSEGLIKLKEKYLSMFSNPSTNTYFIVGTVHRWETFIIIGIVDIDKGIADYPQISLFSRTT